ncbi:SpoIIE family protein phosphatase [Azonexus hydrophilus]|uniref:SpoIIE family protein phosphatase n=1 Tax=Azonexus hydrophilus TaxID=418702 RepID=UPI001FE13FC0|nr:SpoIIE family protein phosphatase [Azonexus hydrophilus]
MTMNNAFEKMSVLAVDDNRTNLHILQVFLKKLGHEVILAENGEEAVARFQQHHPDLVLLDIMMPVMDGFEAARRIKAASRDKWVPIILLSALNRDENLVEGLEAGADDYLTKPINFVVLEAKLRSMQRSLSMQRSATVTLERLLAISDNVPDAIITCNGSGEILTVNRATEIIFGHPAAELVHRQIRLLVPDLLCETAANTTARNREREATGHRRDGRAFPVEYGLSEVSIDHERIFVIVIRDITQRKLAETQLQQNAALLQTYYDHSQNEQQLALRLMEKLLHRPGLLDSRLRYKVIATENFSGDIVAASHSPEGRFYALLADATGHGLPAAISVLPVLALFYRMTRLNRTIRELVIEINQQLKESMPIGRFVAATIVCLDEISLSGEIWIGGTPEALLIDADGQICERFPSENLALGIIDSTQMNDQPRRFEWQPGSQLLMYSDGVLEAADGQGQQFGSQGISDAVQGTSRAERFTALEDALSKHLGQNAAGDDVSLMLIDCP